MSRESATWCSVILAGVCSYALYTGFEEEKYALDYNNNFSYCIVAFVIILFNSLIGAFRFGYGSSHRSIRFLHNHLSWLTQYLAITLLTCQVLHSYSYGPLDLFMFVYGLTIIPAKLVLHPNRQRTFHGFFFCVSILTTLYISFCEFDHFGMLGTSVLILGRTMSKVNSVIYDYEYEIQQHNFYILCYSVYVLCMFHFTIQIHGYVVYT